MYGADNNVLLKAATPVLRQKLLGWAPPTAADAAAGTSAGSRRGAAGACHRRALAPAAPLSNSPLAAEPPPPARDLPLRPAGYTANAWAAAAAAPTAPGGAGGGGGTHGGGGGTHTQPAPSSVDALLPPPYAGSAGRMRTLPPTLSRAYSMLVSDVNRTAATTAAGSVVSVGGRSVGTGAAATSEAGYQRFLMVAQLLLSSAGGLDAGCVEAGSAAASSSGTAAAAGLSQPHQQQQGSTPTRRSPFAVAGGSSSRSTAAGGAAAPAASAASASAAAARPVAAAAGCRSLVEMATLEAAAALLCFTYKIGDMGLAVHVSYYWFWRACKRADSRFQTC